MPSDADRIDQLEGRELDAAVAEARGWTRAVYSNHPFEMHPPGEDFEIRSVPHCHRNIAAAWELVEEMQAEGWTWTLYGGEERVMVFKHLDKGACLGHANLPATAICRAYLKAKEPTDD